MNWWVFAWLLFLTGAEFVAVMAARFTLTRVERLELWVKTFTDEITRSETRSDYTIAPMGEPFAGVARYGEIELPGYGIVTEAEYDDLVESGEYVPPENRNARQVNSHGVPIVRERGRGETAGNPTNVPNPVEKKNARNARNTPENPETGQ